MIYSVSSIKSITIFLCLQHIVTQNTTMMIIINFYWYDHLNNTEEKSPTLAKEDRVQIMTNDKLPFLDMKMKMSWYP